MSPAKEVCRIVATLLIAVASALGQVKGPIVGKAVRSDVSKPLRELAEDAKKAAQAQADREPASKEEKSVVDFLKQKHPAALQSGALALLDDAALAEAFPGAHFFSLRFRQWPVAFEAPAGLSASNVCALVDDKTTVITKAGELEKFFRSELGKCPSEAEQRQAVQAWLLLSEQLHQDGFFRFQALDPEQFKVSDADARVITGQSHVVPQGGNQGRIEVALTFDREGKLQKAVEKADLKQGIRPICQATKLLDPDPLVRRMAQRDILVMGPIARDYLLDQRAQASGELQDAIDSIWTQIQQEGRE
jgi:hypothetical protein